MKTNFTVATFFLFSLPAFAQDTESSSPESDISTMQKMVAQYAHDSSRDPSVIPDYVFYIESIKAYKAVITTTGNTSSLDYAALNQLASPTNSDFNRFIWDGLADVCSHFANDRSASSIANSAFRIDEIIEEHERILGEYYESAIDNLTDYGRHSVLSQVEKLKASNNISYHSIRIAQIAKIDPAIGGMLVNNACGNFSTIDVETELVNAEGLKLGQEPITLKGIRVSR